MTNSWDVAKLYRDFANTSQIGTAPPNQHRSTTSDLLQDVVVTEAQIGGGLGGLRPLAQRGFVTIYGENLTVSGSRGQLIAAAPIANCQILDSFSTKLTGGQTLGLQVGEQRFSITPRVLGLSEAVLGAALPGTNLAGVLRGRAAAKRFREMLEKP